MIAQIDIMYTAIIEYSPCIFRINDCNLIACTFERSFKDLDFKYRSQRFIMVNEKNMELLFEYLRKLSFTMIFQ